MWSGWAAPKVKRTTRKGFQWPGPYHDVGEVGTAFQRGVMPTVELVSTVRSGSDVIRGRETRGQSAWRDDGPVAEPLAPQRRGGVSPWGPTTWTWKTVAQKRARRPPPGR